MGHHLEMTRRTAIFSAICAVGLTCIGTASVANAAPKLYYAVVDPAGKFVRGTAKTTSKKLSTGIYQVVFNAKVSNCAYVAAVGSSTTEVPPPGSIRTASLEGQKGKGVKLLIGNSGALTDNGFHLIVTCP